MTHDPPPLPATEPRRPRWAGCLVVLVAAGLAVGAGVRWGRPWLQERQAAAAADQAAISGEPEEVVRVTGPRRVWVAPDSRLARKLAATPPRREETAAAALTVTGSVAARLDRRDRRWWRPREGHWDFATAELAGTYGDWVKARADLEFARAQADKVRQLTEANVKYLTAVARRKARLAEIGAESEEVKAGAEADRLKAEIQGEKDIHEADTAVRNAVRARDLLERQLLQAGIDPDLLERPERGVVMVVADVPEGQARRVWPGQPCEARFYARRESPYEGRVQRIGTSLSKERRTLRVIFQLNDAEGKLLPGMFADVGLGTEAREVWTVPAAAVLHIGDADYVLVRADDDEYRVAAVEVGEPAGGRVPVKGLTKDDQVLGDNAILLKPAAVQALQLVRP
jgi:hypothetical protein